MAPPGPYYKVEQAKRITKRITDLKTNHWLVHYACSAPFQKNKQKNASLSKIYDTLCSAHPDLDIPHSKLPTRAILGFMKINVDYKRELVHRHQSHDIYIIPESDTKYPPILITDYIALGKPYQLPLGSLGNNRPQGWLHFAWIPHLIENFITTPITTPRATRLWPLCVQDTMAKKKSAKKSPPQVTITEEEKKHEEEEKTADDDEDDEHGTEAEAEAVDGQLGGKNMYVIVSIMFV